jgi:hypothetical protein
VSDGTVREPARFAASAGDREQTSSPSSATRWRPKTSRLRKPKFSAYIQKQLRLEENVFGAVSSESRAKNRTEWHRVYAWRNFSKFAKTL